MSTRQITVGLTPVLLANANDSRSSIAITMLPSASYAANTGTVFVAKGSPPAATVGAPNSGDVLTQGTQWAEVGQFAGDSNVYKGQVWAVADTAAQVLAVDVAYSGN